MINTASKIRSSKSNSFLSPSNSSSIYYIHTSQLKYMMPWSMDNFETNSAKSETSTSVLQNRKRQLKEELVDVSLLIDQFDNL